MRILLTGPTGFLGSALAHHWVAQGHELLLLARSGSRTTRIDDLQERARLVRMVTPNDAAVAVRDFAPDAIAHTGGAYDRAGEAPVDVLDANLRFGTLLLQAALETSGDRPTVFLNTGTALTPDVSLYALSKTQFSAWGAALAKRSPQRLQFIDLRLQQMYGPGDDRSKFTTHVIEACRHNDPRLALTPGEQRRDFIYVDDVVAACDLVLTRRADFSVSDAIEVGSGEAVRMRDFVELAKQLATASTELAFGAVPYRANEAMLCVANTTRLIGLGWQPAVGLADGLARMLATRLTLPDRHTESITPSAT